MIDHPDWSRHFKQCEHLLPIPGNSTFSGRRWLALFLVLAHVARRELESAVALYPALHAMGMLLSLGEAETMRASLD